MRVFWSWQSDHPGAISRHFVRGALEEAIAAINEEIDIADAPRPETTLDHDRKGIPGSPDLAAVILQKISTSNVLVADVTPVGHTVDGGKKLINSNVAIELGYALATVTDRCLLMVLNEHFGAQNDLPFDLRHKAGPVHYRLAPTATKAEIFAEKRNLAGALKVHLRAFLESLPVAPQSSFEPAAPIPGDPSRYVKPNEPVAERRRSEVVEPFRIPAGSLLYLRVLPTRVVPPLSRVEARQIVRGPDGLEPLYYQPTGKSEEANKFGTLVFDADYEAGLIEHGAQLFLSREIWAFDWHVLRPSPNGRVGFRTTLAERTFAVRLPAYLQFAINKLGLAWPLRVEAGASNLQGKVLYMPWQVDNEWGPIQEEHVRWTGLVSSLDPAAIDEALLDFRGVFRCRCGATSKVAAWLSR